ncbi:hypothetical protein A6R68_09635, partial [Neotoma lepida]
MEPWSNVTYFVLLGLSENPKVQKGLLVLFLLSYILTMVGNLLIVMTVTISNSLGSPISSQNTFFGGTEVFLLLAMAYDRYVAICKPFHYLTIMKQWVCVVLLILSWIGGFLHSVIQLSTIYGLPFCGPNIIDHFMCDMYPLLKLVCIDTYVIGVLVMANGGLICMVVFLLLLISYAVILYSLRNLSQEGRWKALSTCGSHITVVVSFFVPCIFIHYPHDEPLDIYSEKLRDDKCYEEALEKK